MYVIPRLALDTFCQHTKCGDFRFSHNRNMIAGIEIEKRVMWPWPRSSEEWFVFHSYEWYSLPGYKI